MACWKLKGGEGGTPRNGVPEDARRWAMYSAQGDRGEDMEARGDKEKTYGSLIDWPL